MISNSSWNVQYQVPSRCVEMANLRWSILIPYVFAISYTLEFHVLKPWLYSFSHQFVTIIQHINVTFYSRPYTARNSPRNVNILKGLKSSVHLSYDDKSLSICAVLFLLTPKEYACGFALPCFVAVMISFICCYLFTHIQQDRNALVQ